MPGLIRRWSEGAWRLFERHDWKRSMLAPLGFSFPKEPGEREVFEHSKERPKFRMPQGLTDEEALAWCNAHRLKGGSAPTFMVYNSAAATTAAPVKQPTGTAIRTMMALRSGVGCYLRVIEWGCSFDGSAAALPGEIELFETTVSATMSTAYLTADIQRFGNSNGPQQGDTALTPIDTTGTTTSGFATAAVTEGTVANYRGADLQLIAPTNQYVKQYPLGREFEIKAQNYLRCRMTFGTTINTYIYVLFEW